MATDQLTTLLEKYLDESITPEEKKRLAILLQDAGHVEQFKWLIHQELSGRSLELEPDEQIGTAIRQYVQQQMHQTEHAAGNVEENIRLHFLPKWIWAAASVILILSIGAYLWTNSKKSTPPLAVVEKPVDIAPGKNGAVLTLADGTQVVLDSLHNGVIANQKGGQVLLKEGKLAYEPDGSGEVAYNTMTTPNGRQFQVTLPDGTKVWLNAASAVTYPTVFTGKERVVKVTGEVYFEVTKNVKMPFRVNVNNKAEIEVLGTHFNVNAYADESKISTTLLEGSVRVTVNSAIRPVVTLKPGQQAQITNGISQAEGTGIKVIENADSEKILAWKNGLFNFNGASLQEVMRQLKRWYDIDVVYEKGIPNITFWGEITRGVSLNDLLIGLEKTGVHFRMEGRKLVVMP